MSLDNVTPGKNVPDAFNVIIEIPMNADPVKYEVDKATGAIFGDVLSRGDIVQGHGGFPLEVGGCEGYQY